MGFSVFDGLGGGALVTGGLATPAPGNTSIFDGLAGPALVTGGLANPLYFPAADYPETASGGVSAGAGGVMVGDFSAYPEGGAGLGGHAVEEYVEATPTYSMMAIPPTIRQSATTLVVLVGNGTRWTTDAPSLSASGPEGFSFGSVTVEGDTRITLAVTTEHEDGDIVWHESTYDIYASQDVGGHGPTMIIGAKSRELPHGRIWRVVKNNNNG